MDLCTAESLDMKFILDLYQQSFPETERKPFSEIERKTAMGSMEMLIIKEKKRRVGFAITAVTEESVLLDYYAFSKEEQGKGYGSEILQLLKELYSEKLFFLEIEEPDEGAENQSERIRRKAFYLKNGMQETGIRIRLFGIPMEILAAQEDMTFEQCRKLYRFLYGPMYQKVVQLTEER